MKAVFHQSYFIPWLGYFSKLEFVDYLVILDDVRFRRDHIKRVQILNSQGVKHWFCLPVGNNWSVPCNTIRLPSETKYIDKMLNTLYVSYGKAKHFNLEFPIFENFFKTALTRNEKLIEANTDILVSIRAHLNAKNIVILNSSNFYSGDNRTERIIEICKANSISEIIMGDGKMASVHNLDLINSNGIKILKQNFNQSQPSYEQVHTLRNGSSFIHGLSILDSLFNIGSIEVKKLISNNKYIPQLLI